MKSSLLAAAVLFIFAPGALHAQDAAAPAAAQTKVENVDPAAAAKLIETAAKEKGKEITIIDVRTPDEFAVSHVKGAKNIDISGPDFEKDLAKLDKDKTYVVHCQAGGRSTRSLAVFGKLGFKKIIHMDGGLAAWKKAGLPVEKPAAK